MIYAQCIILCMVSLQDIKCIYDIESYLRVMETLLKLCIVHKLLFKCMEHTECKLIIHIPIPEAGGAAPPLPKSSKHCIYVPCTSLCSVRNSLYFSVVCTFCSLCTHVCPMHILKAHCSVLCTVNTVSKAHTTKFYTCTHETDTLLSLNID